MLSSSYSSALTNRSDQYCRPSTSCGVGSSHYYEALSLNITVTGSYRIFSQSTIDTFGTLYERSFAPGSPGVNQIYFDDDNNGARQFLIETVLTAGNPYILVVTTFAADIQGAFAVVITGPASVAIRRMNVSSK